MKIKRKEERREGRKKRKVREGGRRERVGWKDRAQTLLIKGTVLAAACPKER
jgi:hypothetical protein